MKLANVRLVHAICAFLMLALCPGAGAHPLGNNTVSRQAVLDPSDRHITLIYRMDLAEIPTLAAADEADRDGDGTTTQAEWQTYAVRWSRELQRSVVLAADGSRLQLAAHDTRFRLRPGEAGLVVLFLETELQGAWAEAARHDVRYRDGFRPRDAGWKEVMIREHQGLRIDGAVARSDRSRGLSDYPKDGGLLQELSAAFKVEWLQPAGHGGTPAAQPELRPGAARGGPDAAAQPAMRADAGDGADRTDRTGPGGTSLSSFFVLGMHHIAIGLDHLAFLLGLLLLSQRAGQLIKLVSAFTVAHSVTLILAASRLVSPPGAWVEPAIAFTIAYVGFIAWRGRATAHGAVLAFLFGLIHGFGFAGALAESLGDAARGPYWLLDLLAFNLGIEAFQVMLVVVAVAFAARMRTVSWRASAHAAASLAVFGAGLSWLALRLVAPGQA